MAASSSSDDIKTELNEQLKIEASLSSENELNLTARDFDTKRLFESSYTKSELAKRGFNQMFSMKQIESVVQGALKGDKSTTISTGYVPDSSSDKIKKMRGQGKLNNVALSKSNQMRLSI